jgi:FlaA1/EpsC-like NDP-sugar epimerase
VLTRRLAFFASYAGIAAVVLGLSKAHATWIADPPYDFTQSFRLPWALVFVAFLSATAYSVGLPDVPRRRRQIMAASTAAVGFATAAVSALQLVVGSALMPRFVIVGSSLALLPWFAMSALLASRGHQRARRLDRAVVIGAQEDSRNLVHELDETSERPGRVVAVLHPDEARPTAADQFPVRTVVEAHEATVVVLDRDAQASQLIVDQVALLHEQGISRWRSPSCRCWAWRSRSSLSATSSPTGARCSTTRIASGRAARSSGFASSEPCGRRSSRPRRHRGQMSTTTG